MRLVGVPIMLVRPGYHHARVWSKQSGFNLIELMVGLVVGLVVLGAALTAFLLILTTQKENNQIVRLNQDMRAIADLMVRDIRRAGFLTDNFDNPESTAEYLLDNIFFKEASGADLTVVNMGSSTTSINGSGNCIMYSYNRDNDYGTNGPELDSNEHFGFKIANNAIWVRVSGTTNSDVDCEDGGWYQMNNDSVDFTGLNFTVSSAIYDVTNEASTASASCPVGNSCLIVRTVDISMTAQVEDLPNITQTIEETVRLRNDKFVASVASGSEYATP